MKYDEFVEDEDHIGDQLRLDSRADLTESRNRKWFQKWRLQYNINIGNIQTRDAFTSAEIYSKVSF